MQTHLAPEYQNTHEGREAEAILRKCVHCGFCTATCPTYQLLGDELDGPRGRIYLIKQVLEGCEVGPFGGMTGVQARLRGALFPGDTIHVEGEARLLPTTSRGYTLMELQHLVINQRGETIADFTETITFLPQANSRSLT